MVAVHRRLEGSDHPRQRLDRHLDPGAEAPRRGEQHAVDRRRRTTGGRVVTHRAQTTGATRPVRTRHGVPGAGLRACGGSRRRCRTTTSPPTPRPTGSGSSPDRYRSSAVTKWLISATPRVTVHVRWVAAVGARRLRRARGAAGRDGQGEADERHRHRRSCRCRSKVLWPEPPSSTSLRCSGGVVEPVADVVDRRHAVAPGAHPHDRLLRRERRSVALDQGERRDPRRHGDGGVDVGSARAAGAWCRRRRSGRSGTPTRCRPTPESRPPGVVVGRGDRVDGLAGDDRVGPSDGRRLAEHRCQATFEVVGGDDHEAPRREVRVRNVDCAVAGESVGEEHQRERTVGRCRDAAVGVGRRTAGSRRPGSGP